MQNYIAGGVSLPNNIPATASTTSVAEGPYTYYVGNNRGTLIDTRRGDVTRGKSKGVKFIIKVLQSPVGEFKDDCLQDHVHKYARSINAGQYVGASGVIGFYYTETDNETSGVNNARSTTTTHGKQKGVKYIIKVL